MNTLQFQGKTTEEAIENACKQLNLSKHDLEFEILEPGSSGIFGLVGGRKAKIRVHVPKPAAPEKEIKINRVPLDEKTDDSTEYYCEDTDLGGEELDIARNSLESILNLIPMDDTKVKAENVANAIILSIDGDKSGILIGRKGRTLDSLQFIVNKIVNKSLQKKVHVVIDSENYRQRREEFLVQMALKMGNKVKKTNKSMGTNLLNPHDRRIVHMALREEEGLDTKSRGDGVLKRVIIIPKK